VYRKSRAHLINRSLRSLIQNKTLVACSKNPEHMHFSKGCGLCVSRLASGSVVHVGLASASPAMPIVIASPKIAGMIFRISLSISDGASPSLFARMADRA
jgi:hypothetical protein